MSFLGFIYFLIIAFLIVLFFSFIFNVRGPWGSFWTFFLIIFFSIWIADIWLRPLGPYWRDVYWLPPLVAGILVAFVLAAATPSQSKARRILSKDTDRREDTSTVALGLFFWLTLILLVILVIAGLLQTDVYP